LKFSTSTVFMVAKTCDSYLCSF